MEYVHVIFSPPIGLSASWISLLYNFRLLSVLIPIVLFLRIGLSSSLSSIFLSFHLPHQFVSCISFSSPSVSLSHRSLSFIIFFSSSFAQTWRNLSVLPSLGSACNDGLSDPYVTIPNLDSHSRRRKWHGKHSTKSTTYERRGEAPRASPGVIYRAGRSWT